MRRRSATAPLLAALGLAVLAARAAAVEDPVRAALRAEPTRAVVEMTIASGWHVNGHAPRDEFLVPTTLTFDAPPAGTTIGAVAYPEAVERKLAFSETPLLLYEGTVTMTAPLGGTTAVGLHAKLRYQACNDATCLPPKTIELTATAPTAAATNSGPGAAGGGGDEFGRLVERIGWAGTFAWVLLLGVALNLTPCVYPLISVTVAFFGGRSGTDTGRAVRHAALYVLGICLTFSALGTVAALTGSLFGAALQKPLVLGGIALVMVALAASNFGLWQLRPPTALMQMAGRASEGAAGAFFMGLTMGIVAAPCIGPIVAALLLWVGARQDPLLGFALFFTLGTGLGLPYLALAMAARRLRALPRSGAWLGWMEHLFGFVLLGIALHFATPLLPDVAVRLAWSLLLATAGVVLGFAGAHGGRIGRPARALAGGLVLLVGVGSFFRAEADDPITWTPYSAEALASARAAGRPVLIDFQAAWCIPCREMDQTTFRDPAVVAATRRLAMLRADLTAQDDAASALMEAYHVPGVPTFVLLDAGGEERRRMVGFVDADAMRAALEEVGGRG